MCNCSCAKYNGEKILKIDTHPMGLIFAARQFMVTVTNSGETRTYTRYSTNFSCTTWSEWQREGS